MRGAAIETTDFRRGKTRDQKVTLEDIGYRIFLRGPVQCKLCRKCDDAEQCKV